MSPRYMAVGPRDFIVEMSRYRKRRPWLWRWVTRLTGIRWTIEWKVVAGGWQIKGAHIETEQEREMFSRCCCHPDLPRCHD